MGRYEGVRVMSKPELCPYCKAPIQGIRVETDAFHQYEGGNRWTFNGSQSVRYFTCCNTQLIAKDEAIVRRLGFRIRG